MSQHTSDEVTITLNFTRESNTVSVHNTGIYIERGVTPGASILRFKMEELGARARAESERG
eukprot:scaffold19416_cov41-Phaeocystis_antarctica.AAC.2